MRTGNLGMNNEEQAIPLLLKGEQSPCPETMKLPVQYDSLKRNKRKEVREEYIRIQRGLCFYCQNLLIEKPAEEVTAKPINMKLFPPGFLDYPVHLHHDHSTGLTEGSVHAYCNAVLWQYKGQ